MRPNPVSTALYRTAALFLLCACLLPVHAAGGGQCAHRNLALQFLGTGGPVSDDARASSSSVLWWKGKSHLLFDIGGGAFLRFGQAGASLEDLAFIGLSHFHTDHVTDLPALLKGAVFSVRKEELPMAGPAGSKAFPGLEDFMKRQFGAERGVYAYLSGLLDGSNNLFRVRYKDIPYEDKLPRKVYSDADMTVYAKSVPHGNVPTLAWRIEVDGRRIVLSPDQNGKDSTFLDFARGADVLVMPMALHERAGKASRRMHALPSQVGQIARDANAGVLLLNHFMGKSLHWQQESISEVKKKYDGPVFAGQDLFCFSFDPAQRKS